MHWVNREQGIESAEITTLRTLSRHTRLQRKKTMETSEKYKSCNVTLRLFENIVTFRPVAK
jgi:hypothetical protein